MSKEVTKVDQETGSDPSRSSGFFNGFRRKVKRRGNMSKKSGWLLGLLILTLAVGGLFSPANAMLEDIESVDFEGDGTNNDFGIPLVEVLIEGDTGENDRDWLGTLQIMKLLNVGVEDNEAFANEAAIITSLNGSALHQDLKDYLKSQFGYNDEEVDNRASVEPLVPDEQWLITVVDESYTAPDGSTTFLVKVGASLDFYIPEWLSIYEGSVADGDHELDGLNSATVDDNSGFDDPNDPGTDTDRVRTNWDGEYMFSCLVPPNVLPVGSTTGFVSAFRFYGTEIGALEGAIAFKVLLPVYDDVDIDPEDVVRNGDEIELRIDLEDADSDEMENCTLLPDFSNLDSAFHDPIETANDGAAYTNDWPDSDADPDTYGLDELVADVQRAILEGRMSIEDKGNGSYTVTYTISEGNVTSSGPKSVNVRAVAYPGTLAMNQMATIYDAFGFDSSAGEIFMTLWTTGDNLDADPDPDTADIELDNLPPNFDFAMIDPFATPKAMPIDEPEGEFAYIYKGGNKIRVMVQIDPHDLNIDEMSEVDPPDPGDDYDDGVIDLTVDDITVWGDFSALFPEAYLLAHPADANNNGIPDVAEVTADYAGDNSDDDDWDGTEANVEDEEDSTENGFNERFLYIFEFVVNENCLGVSGIPATTGPLPIRFAIEDSIGNMRHYSAWRETYNEETNDWEEVTVAGWTSALGRSEFFFDAGADGIIDQQNPIHY